MYLFLQKRLSRAVAEFLRRTYGLELPSIVIEQPPKVELGEYALPLSFELARQLRKAPKKIAEEIVAGIGAVEGFASFEVAGAGYINARVDRAALAKLLVSGERPVPAEEEKYLVAERILVEHTSINPNKAAHIGHLRNSILGDTFVRLLRATGRHVAVQNYIDNTGVQVADVIVGLVHLENKSRAVIERMIAADRRIDFTLWDLYARVSSWYEQDKANLKNRLDMLHAIEDPASEMSQVGEMVSTSVLRRHLQTMERLAVEYDFLPRESEILHLHFWDAAFELLKQRDVVFFETQGEKQGCWVMKRPSATGKKKEELTDDDIKVIVRSNGTVVYEGKDIAYHLWKFGLLPGKDFGYRRFHQYRDGREVWISCDPREGDADHPHFGDVHAIYNVIDSRQAEAQNTVLEALRALGHEAQAQRYTHFSYEMVALTPRCAADLGYPLSEEDWARPYIEVSGRRGFGVKADDFLDALIGAAKKEVDARHPELEDPERKRIASQIAVGALRYFMLKFTKNSVIAFDLREALAFEGETGPYAQYAVVRASNIFRKAGTDPEKALEAASGLDFSRFFAGETGAEIWELWLAAAKTSMLVDQCISTTEPAYAAKHAFMLAQTFNNFYHRHHILTEEDPARKTFLLATAAVLRRELVRVLDLMGISVPRVM